MEPHTNRSGHQAGTSIRKFLDPATLALTYTCSPEDVETVRSGLVRMGFIEMDASETSEPGSGFGAGYVHCGYVFARFNMWNTVEEYAIVNEVPGLVHLGDELEKANARIKELEATIADIRHEQGWDIEDEGEDEERLAGKWPTEEEEGGHHETYTCSVCGMALMARGAELDMPNRQLTISADGKSYCPQCYIEAQQDAAERETKARIDP